jgi:hypothetical protein
MHIFSEAAPGHIVGRIVGESGAHIAVTVKPETEKTGTLLAVHRHGGEYAVWSYGWNMAESGVNTWNGHYFSATVYGGAFEAFTAATEALNGRFSG